MYIILFFFSNFFLQTARVQKYPEKRFDDESVAASNEGQSKWYKDHSFDYSVEQKRKVSNRKKDISKGNEPMHRVHNVHSKFHKVDESMLPAMYRSNVPRQYDSEKDKDNQVNL